MRLIIDIPEDDYKFIKDLQFYNSGRRSGRTIERNVINGIKNGKSYEEKPHGEWIKTPELFRDRICSHCGKQISYEQIGKFCIECGADMRGKENER